MNTITSTTALFASAVDCAAPVRRFVSAHFDGLWHAARLLGGHEAARNVERLGEALASEVVCSRSTRHRLLDLQELLTLKNVGDPERPEMGFFAVIDPSDPCVEEICLLADGLSHAIASWIGARTTGLHARSTRVPSRRAA